MIHVCMIHVSFASFAALCVCFIYNHVAFHEVDVLISLDFICLVNFSKVSILRHKTQFNQLTNQYFICFIHSFIYSLSSLLVKFTFLCQRTMSKRERVILSLDMVGSEDIDVTGEKPPIIFLHGMTSAKETWKKVLRPIAVATGRKAYAFDARNHGDSGWSNESDYGVMVEDLLEVMDVLLIDRAILVGHSMGGKTAMFFAGKWPQRVEKLIVEDISPKHAPTHIREQTLKYLHLLKHAVEQIPKEMSDLEEAKNFVHDFLEQNINQDNHSSRQGASDGSRLPIFKDGNGEFKWKTNFSVIEKLLSVPNTTNVSEIYSSPTLILYGTKSPYKVSADRDFIRQYFPSAQFRAVEGAFHQIHLEYEDIFVKEVADFINES